MIRNELGSLMRNHLLAHGGICRAATGAGVSLHVQSDANSGFRITWLAEAQG